MISCKIIAEFAENNGSKTATSEGSLQGGKGERRKEIEKVKSIQFSLIAVFPFLHRSLLSLVCVSICMHD